MARGWSNPLGGFAAEVEKQISAQVNEMVLFALQQLIFHSPVQDGGYRGSHFVTIDGIDRDRVPPPDKGGERVMREAEQIMAASAGKPFKLVTIQTNIAYGLRIENGWSSQAPQGVYAIAANNTRERYGR
ncbi:hypothetical protein [Vreelandella maris]|uniref:hypothetical protein n=1 Tax=Vreelandella maris TaxID=2729617 RepID=UPI0030EBCD76